MTRVAVTGATGFVAKHLINRLIDDGVNVTAISRNGTKRTDVLDIAVDFGDIDALRSALKKIDIVVHLAARAHRLNETGDADEIEARYYVANTLATESLSAAAKLEGVHRFVLMSSIGVNGNQTCGKAFSIKDAPNPTEPYAKSKLMAEKAVERVLFGSKTDYVILRPPLVYGPDCPGNFNKLLQLAYKAPILPLGGIRSPRTFINVHNLVDAIVTVLSVKNISNRTFLVSDAHDLNVGTILKLISTGFGRGDWRILNVSPVFLGFVAKLAGKGNAWEKLTASLEVDGSDFRIATGWTPPIANGAGVLEMAEEFLSKIK
jgi:nucleoside-diphosphate-sugar epimerase